MISPNQAGRRFEIKELHLSDDSRFNFASTGAWLVTNSKAFVALATQHFKIISRVNTVFHCQALISRRKLIGICLAYFVNRSFVLRPAVPGEPTVEDTVESCRSRIAHYSNPGKSDYWGLFALNFKPWACMSLLESKWKMPKLINILFQQHPCCCTVRRPYEIYYHKIPIMLSLNTPIV